MCLIRTERERRYELIVKEKTKKVGEHEAISSLEDEAEQAEQLVVIIPGQRYLRCLPLALHAGYRE